MSKLVDEFKEQHQHLTKACIENKIRDIAIRERREGQTKWWIRTCSDEPNFQGLMENEANFNRKTRSTGRYLSAEQITEDPDDLYELLDSPKFAPQLLDEYQIQWLLHISNEYFIVI